MHLIKRIFTNDIASIFRPTIIKMHFLEVHLSTLNVMYACADPGFYIFRGGGGHFVFQGSRYLPSRSAHVMNNSCLYKNSMRI